MLKITGITSTDVILGINLGTAIASGIPTAVGASFMDRFGRRMVLCASSLSPHGNTPAAKASEALIFLVSGMFSIAYTPLQQIYPAEILSFEQR
ncbi:hypothetical protein F5882DRAFT_465762 [Hyaloscypha sp. PMI_1271]|nr:hypothetical protein F5882DRAFT_465762 [Hyaloscypha sp. PMI_1271]